MPIEHRHTVKAGTTRQSFFVYATAEHDPRAAKTGLADALASATAAYVRDGESCVHPIALTAARLGEWRAGSFAEVDAALMPGVYQLGAPDEMLASGSTRAVLCVRFPRTFIAPLEVSLVAFDPQDSERMGVWSLASDKRHEFLRRALPRLTEMELALGAEAEAALRAQRAAARRD